VRVVREALGNCVRHANGAVVEVTIGPADGAASVAVRSRGGAPTATAGQGGDGWGLQMLRERITALGGTFRAGPEPDGWLVEARLPVEVRA
ncbi:sensor histidine kinase, partial [Microbacterium sp. RD02]|nr:sensor histidine kinase [Microbacterium sp. RD02]